MNETIFWKSMKNYEDWFSVERALPLPLPNQSSIEVLVFFKETPLRPGFISISKFFPQFWGWGEYEDISHWMHLPEKP